MPNKRIAIYSTIIASQRRILDFFRSKTGYNAYATESLEPAEKPDGIVLDVHGAYRARTRVSQRKVSRSQHEIGNKSDETVLTAEYIDKALTSVKDDGVVFLKTCYAGALAKDYNPGDIGAKRIFCVVGSKHPTPMNADYLNELMTTALEANQQDPIYEPYLSYPQSLVWYQDKEWHKISSIKYDERTNRFYRKYKVLKNNKWTKKTTIFLDEKEFSKSPKWLGSVLLASLNKEVSDTDKASEQNILAKKLLEHGADMDYAMRSGYNLLEMLSSDYHSVDPIDVAQVLLRFGAQPITTHPSSHQMDTKRAFFELMRTANARWEHQERAVQTISNCIEKIGVTINQIATDTPFSGPSIDVRHIRACVAHLIYEDHFGEEYINEIAGEIELKDYLKTFLFKHLVNGEDNTITEVDFKKNFCRELDEIPEGNSKTHLNNILDSVNRARNTWVSGL